MRYERYKPLCTVTGRSGLVVEAEPNASGARVDDDGDENMNMNMKNTRQRVNNFAKRPAQ